MEDHSSRLGDHGRYPLENILNLELSKKEFKLAKPFQRLVAARALRRLWPVAENMFSQNLDSLSASNSLVSMAERQAVELPTSATKGSHLRNIKCENLRFYKPWVDSIVALLNRPLFSTAPLRSVELSWQAYREYIFIVDEYRNEKMLRDSWKRQICRDVTHFESFNERRIRWTDESRCRIFVDPNIPRNLEYCFPIRHDDSAMEHIV